jgi:hypothetical protein
MVNCRTEKKVLNEVRSDKNIIKMKVVQKLSGTSGGDRYTGTVADNNARRRGNGGRCSGGESTSIRCNMICGAGVEVPFMLGRLLELKCL